MRKIKAVTADMEIMFNKLALSHLTGPLDKAAAFTRFLSEITPARTSMRQVYSFMVIVQANAMGRSVTLTDVREIVEPLMGQHLARSYQLFLSPEEAQDIEALGWVETQVDMSDRRKKYLILTHKGRDIATQIAQWMENK